MYLGCVFLCKGRLVMRLKRQTYSNAVVGNTTSAALADGRRIFQRGAGAVQHVQENLPSVAAQHVTDNLGAGFAGLL